jgi:hypothetical protein
VSLAHADLRTRIFTFSLTQSFTSAAACALLPHACIRRAPATRATRNEKYRYPSGAPFTSAAVLCAVHSSPVRVARMNTPAVVISDQLPGLLLGSSHSAALSAASSSH